MVTNPMLECARIVGQNVYTVNSHVSLAMFPIVSGGDEKSQAERDAQHVPPGESAAGKSSRSYGSLAT